MFLSLILSGAVESNDEIFMGALSRLQTLLQIRL